jgi:hypothetical protein
MGLTGEATVDTTAGVAAAGLALLVWLWPRLAGPGARAVVARFAAILAVQLALLTATATAVNASYQFFGSWSELFGTVQTAPVSVTGVVTASGGSGGDALVQPGGTEQLDRVTGLPTGPARRTGRVESVRIIGRRTGVVDPAFVYLPPQYFQPAYARQRFPVVVALSGYPGSIYNLAQHLRVPQQEAALLAKGRVQPTVVVMIRPTVAPPRDTECVDVPGGPHAETFLARDLPDALRATYRVGADASAWGVLGYSSGGSCALQLAMRHPGVYTAAAALSADYRVADDPTTGDLFGSGPGRAARVRSHDLLWRLRHRPVPRVAVLVACSRSGELGYPQTLAFARAVRPPMRVATILPARGSHNFPTWVRELPATLTWMSRQLTFPQDVVPLTGTEGTGGAVGTGSGAGADASASASAGAGAGAGASAGADAGTGAGAGHGERAGRGRDGASPAPAAPSTPAPPSALAFPAHRDGADAATPADRPRTAHPRPARATRSVPPAETPERAPSGLA